MSATVLRASGLTPQRWRALGVAFGVAIGVGLMVALTSVNATGRAAFRSALEEVTGRADLRISAGEAGFAEEVLDDVRARPEVMLATPLVQGTVFVGDETGEALQIFGVDLVDQDARSLYQPAGGLDQTLFEDPLLFLNQADSVVIPSTLARRRGWGRNTVMTVLAPSGKRELTVRGVGPDTGIVRLYDARVIVMDIYAAQLVLARHGRIDSIEVVVRPGVATEVAAAALRPVLPESVAVERPEERSRHAERMLRSFGALVEMSGMLALVLATFLAANTAASTAVAQRREIGILRALGARRRDLLWVTLAGAAVVGLTGAAMGTVLAIGLVRVLRDSVSLGFNLQFVTSVSRDALTIETRNVWQGLGVGCAATILGTVLPIWAATRGVSLDTVQQRTVRAQRVARWTPVSGAACLASGLAMLSLGVPAQRSTLALIPLIVGGLFLVPLGLRGTVACLGFLRRCSSRGSARLVSAIAFRLDARTTAVVTGLTLTVTAIVLLAAIGASVEESVAALLSKQLRGDLIVTSTHAAAGWLQAPLPGELDAALRAVPGVQRIVTVRSVEQRYRGDTIRVRAVGGAAEDAALIGALLVDGDPARAWSAFRSGSGVMVSRNLTRHHGIAVGDRLRLDTPMGVHEVDVAGIIADLSSPRGGITIERERYRRWWGDDLVNVFEIHLDRDRGISAATVRQEIVRRLGPGQSVRVLSVAEHRRESLTRVRRAFAFTRVAEALVLLVLALAFADNLAAGVSERSREFAILRAIGATRSQMAALIVEEAVVLGLAGGVFGALLGSVVAATWLTLHLESVIGFAVDFSFPTPAVLRAVMAAGAVAGAAALLPSRRGARLPTLSGLRGA